MDKFYEDNRSTVVVEATLRGYNITDCIVQVNLTELPASIQVSLLRDDPMCNELTSVREKVYETQNMVEGVAYRFVVPCDDNKKQTLAHSFRDWEWSSEQARVKNQMQDELNAIKRSPELRKKKLAELQTKYVL